MTKRITGWSGRGSQDQVEGRPVRAIDLIVDSSHSSKVGPASVASGPGSNAPEALADVAVHPPPGSAEAPAMKIAGPREENVVDVATRLIATALGSRV